MLNVMPPLAELFDAGTLALLIPIIALTVPIVAILTKHQQRMAELIHGGQNQSNSYEVAQLREEVRRLSENVSHLTLLVDSRSEALPPASTEDIKNRIGLGY